MPHFQRMKLSLCRADGVGVRAAPQEEADEDRGRDRRHSGIPPLGRCHILARQVQGESVPLWGESDLILLGPHGCPLLPRWVGTQATYKPTKDGIEPWTSLLAAPVKLVQPRLHAPALALSETTKGSKIRFQFTFIDIILYPAQHPNHPN